MTNEIPIELLNDAFNVFREASTKLEQQYAMLETRIEDLSAELAEKNRAIERSRRLSAMGEMAARIAHEIRNPLGSMAIFSTLLERELSAEPDRKKLATHISTGIKTLDNLLSNMLLFANSPEARLKAVDIKEIIEDSVLLAKGREKKGVEIDTSFAGQTQFAADPNLLRQLFLNLIINALDAVGEGGRLEITARMVEKKKRCMEIKVKDNGGGIPVEHLDRIFDPFFTTKDRGTGLGLAIVTTVVDAHRGYMKVDSSKGDGTTFTIGLPAGEMEMI